MAREPINSDGSRYFRLHLLAWEYGGDIRLKKTFPDIDPKQKRLLGTMARMLIGTVIRTTEASFKAPIGSDTHSWRKLVDCPPGESRRWSALLELASRAHPGDMREAMRRGYESGQVMLQDAIGDLGLGHSTDEVMQHLPTLYVPPADVPLGELWLPPALEG